MDSATEPKYQLYFDDSGSRDLDHQQDTRTDMLDYFGLGGVLVREEDVKGIVDNHKDLCGKWNIDYPLHSTAIRGRRRQFSWLGNHKNQNEFLADLQRFIVSAPIVCVACIINRPGYFQRYRETHKERLWLMCKTAYTIMLERSAKFSDRENRKLEVYFEQTGKKEDRNIVAYTRDLKSSGNPFDSGRSGNYSPLDA